MAGRGADAEAGADVEAEEDAAKTGEEGTEGG